MHINNNNNNKQTVGKNGNEKKIIITRIQCKIAPYSPNFKILTWIKRRESDVSNHCLDVEFGQHTRKLQSN